MVHVAQPISTRNLYYTSSVCFVPDSVDCADSTANDSALIFKRERYGDCNKKNYLFILENDGTLRHQCSGKVVCPDSKNYLSLKSKCPDDKGKYKRLAVRKVISNNTIIRFRLVNDFVFDTMLLFKRILNFIDLTVIGTKFQHDCGIL